MNETTKSYRHDEAQTDTRLDRNSEGVIGKPIDRFEGALKVTGTAPYAYENRKGENVAYGYLVVSEIGSGTVEAIETAKAESARGVIKVVVDDRAVRFSGEPGASPPNRVDGKVQHYGQPICVVVAETFEAARAAAKLVEVRYGVGEGRYDLKSRQSEAYDPGDEMGHVTNGDFEKAFAASEVTFDATFTTPSQSHSAMEPHACIAAWDGEMLTLHGCYQLVSENVQQVAKALGIAPEKVRVLSPYIGGGFGGKLGIGPEAVYASIATMEIGRPVKIALTRQQVYQATNRRSDTVQRIRLGCSKDGRITALAHDTIGSNSPGDAFIEPAGISTMFLYASENRLITHRKVDLNLLLSAAMRAPGEAVGMLSLENAMDEMAEKLGLDPIEFRRINEPKVDPQEGLPFSSRMLVECMDEGAKRFGWDQRPKTPGSRRDGEWLIGYGMASASRKNLLMKSSARVTLSADGRASVETNMTDIGTGTYTILQQIAAEMLGLQPDHVEVTLGESQLPRSPGSGGSWGAQSVGSSVYVACEGIAEAIAAKLGVSADALTLKDGTAIADNRQTALADILEGEPISVLGKFEPGQAFKETHQASYGAHFCEVGVNSVTGETRVRRLLTVGAAGRILNEKTAKSQCYGGQIFGIGAALTEELVVDARSGLMVNHDLAEYHVPVNADVPQLEVVLLDERDRLASPLAGKGIGELAIAGVGAAVTNAIYNACGVRVRDYPMTLDKVLKGMPAESFAEAAE